MDSDRLRTHALALPCAFAAAALCKALVLPGMLFWYFFSIPMHELGHSVVAWLGGHIAIPIGAIIPMAGFTQVFDERSLIMIGLDLAAIGGALYWGARERKPFLIVLAFVALLVFWRLCFKTSLDDWRTAMSWGGVAGEHWIGTLLLLAFYHELPDKLRWDFFRFPLLLPAAWSFGSAYWNWFEISRNKADMPWGSFLDGGGDSGGDLDRLIEAGWSVKGIVSSYRHLGNACALLIAGYYLYFLWQARQEARADSA